MASAAKTASQSELTKAENKFIRLCDEYPEGLPDDVLQARLENVAIETRAQLVNSLLGQGRLVLLQQGDRILYKIVRTELTEKFTGLDHEGILIYRLIEQSNDRGVWLRDLRSKSGLTQPAVAKIIKILMQKRLVKEIKSVQNNRKVYLKFDVEPCRDLTGGALSFGADLDAEFVNVLREACVKYIEKHGEASADDLGQFLYSTRISNVVLETGDVEQIINSLLYDTAIEKVAELTPAGGVAGSKRKRDETLYRVAKIPSEINHYASVPCSVCVVAHACVDGGQISPSSCEYFRAWLDF